MRFANPTCLLFVSIFLAPLALADDKSTTLTNELATSASATNIWLADLALVVQAQPHYRNPSSLPLGASSTPIIDLELKEVPALKRISRLRNLSLLTLANKGQMRFFLGVNADGLVGLHITLLSRRDEGRIFELLRMPYLRQSQSFDDLIRADKESP
jgi:hypothetical protein